MAGRPARARRAAGFVAHVYGARVRRVVDAHVRRNEFARLDTAAGLADPYRVYDRIRERGPFVSTPRGHLATADHAVCLEVLRDRRFGTEPEGTSQREYDRSFLTRNPPDHTRLRRLVAPAFTARRLDHVRDVVGRTVDGLLDAAAAAGTFDLMDALAQPLPVTVINDLLGIPPEQGVALAAYGETLGEAANGFRSLRQARRVAVAAGRLTRGFEDLVDHRRRDPGEDLLSALLAAEGPEDAQIRTEEIMPLCRMLLIAGFETTVNLLGNAVDALLNHPDQWAALVADPSLAGAAVQETARFDPPVQRTGRISFDDTEIAGRPVAAGQWVNVLIGGANHDPAVFADPHRFDILRTDVGEHLAFSSGIHRCIGRAVAELEVSVALARLAERMPHLRRAGAVRRRPTSLVRGPLALPVTVGD